MQRAAERQFVKVGRVEGHDDQHEDGSVQEGQQGAEQDAAETDHVVGASRPRSTPEKRAKITSTTPSMVKDSAAPSGQL